MGGVLTAADERPAWLQLARSAHRRGARRRQSRRHAVPGARGLAAQRWRWWVMWASCWARPTCSTRRSCASCAIRTGRCRPAQWARPAGWSPRYSIWPAASRRRSPGTAAPAGCQPQPKLQRSTPRRRSFQYRPGRRQQRKSSLPGGDLDAHAAVALDFPGHVVHGAVEGEGRLEQAQHVQGLAPALAAGPALLQRWRAALSGPGAVRPSAALEWQVRAACQASGSSRA